MTPWYPASMPLETKHWVFLLLIDRGILPLSDWRQTLGYPASIPQETTILKYPASDLPETMISWYPAFIPLETVTPDGFPAQDKDTRVPCL